VLLIKPAGGLAYQGDHVVRMPKVQNHNPAVLAERSYKMLDAIVNDILSNPNFQNAFF
jgi:hypothetical protein